MMPLVSKNTSLMFCFNTFNSVSILLDISSAELAVDKVVIAMEERFMMAVGVLKLFSQGGLYVF